jgi:hypothetical protein
MFWKMRAGRWRAVGEQGRQKFQTVEFHNKFFVDSGTEVRAPCGVLQERPMELSEQHQRRILDEFFDFGEE